MGLTTLKQIFAIFETYKTQNEAYLNTHGRNWRVLFTTYVQAAQAQKPHPKHLSRTWCCRKSAVFDSSSLAYGPGKALLEKRTILRYVEAFHSGLLPKISVPHSTSTGTK
ncbi:hypothetical protein BXP70_25800 [Hymenobacter crusticola]|uniref:Uncharacterized protein n=1 Tax=Hymenobacter crusticola TaxID=1770526 RepID=A0A243W6F1_9BACT|nr:hypothetical protein BXP70_25800 [Hymenobacter crusticola]